MDNRDDILKRIIEDRPPVAPEDEQVHRALTRYFEGKRNKAMALTTAYLLLAIVFSFAGIFLLAVADDVRLMLFGVVALLFGVEMNVLMKLWFWIIDNRITVTKALKETQLMLLRSSATPDDAARRSAAPVWSGLGDANATFWERLDPAFVRKCARAVIVGATVLMVCGLTWVIPVFHVAGWGALMFAKAGVQQEDRWHFTVPEKITANSTLSFSRASHASSLELRLPYENGHVESVTANDDETPLPFTERGPGVYVVNVDPACKKLLVAWSFPFDDLASCECGYCTKLRSLVPVDAYSLEVAVAADGPFQIKDHPSQLTGKPFYGTFGKPGTDFGSCGVMVVKRADAAPAPANAAK